MVQVSMVEEIFMVMEILIGLSIQEVLVMDLETGHVLILYKNINITSSPGKAECVITVT